MSVGHPDAHSYPLATLWAEVEIARDRQNAEYATQAVLLQNAVSSLLDKESAKHFKQVIERLNDGKQ